MIDLIDWFQHKKKKNTKCPNLFFFDIHSVVLGFYYWVKKIKGMNFNELVTRTLNMCISMLHENGNGNAESKSNFFFQLGIGTVYIY